MTIFLLIALLVVFIHECGHYFTCKMFGIPVDDFNIGFGQSIIKYRPRRTTFHVRLILFGGYVTPNQIVYQQKPFWVRIIVALSGPLINIVPVVILAVIATHDVAIFKAMWEIPFKLIAEIGNTALHPIDYLHTSTHLKQTFAQSTENQSSSLMAIKWYLILSLVVGSLNLLPIFPMDGYLVVREILTVTLGKEKTDNITMGYGLLCLFVLAYLTILSTVGMIVGFVSFLK